MKKRLKLLAVFFTWLCLNQVTAQMDGLIPPNTATHTAVQNGSWFDASTWDTGTVPTAAAIVLIPNGLTVEYQGCSDAHLFAIRVDGTFICTPNTAGASCLTFDTFLGTHNSIVKFLADNDQDENIDITIAPFDIEAHKAGLSGYTQIWNNSAKTYFSDGAAVDKVVREVTGDRRYNTYEEAINGNTTVVELSRDSYDDGAGVTGRYNWDPTQLSLGLLVMGQIEIIGQEKRTMSKLSTDANEGQAVVQLENLPTGWRVGDKILITRGGNASTSNNGEDVLTIAAITGTTIIGDNNLEHNHHGRPAEDLHCYVGNLTRNITFKSADKNHIHRRGHFMAMHNSTNIQIRNAAFVDMGRTDKSRVVDDFIWKEWLEPNVFKSKISPLGQEICEMQANPPQDVTNSRGRYSIHLHKTGASHSDNLVHVTGNVVWGNPGWGITHHDAYADVSNNVVFDVTGGGIVSESGSELGFWNNNLVVDIKEGHEMSPYDAAVFHDEYLFSGQGLAMKGRGVICKNNVIANATQGVGVINMNPSITNHDRVDPIALATFRPDYEFDQFPLSQKGYSREGNGVMPVEVALIMENTTVIGADKALRSIERDMGVNHESRSVFDGFHAWGVTQGFSINYQADYSFKDVFISGDGSSNSVGVFMWKHSHNQTFENIKMADLDVGILVSKLVESDNGELKTRNNGFTPWVFVDLETENVAQLYGIEKDDPATSTEYVEHGDNTIHLNSNDLADRPVTFTILDSTDLVVNYADNDFRFEVDGIITDDFGTYDMGIRQAAAQGTLRLDYPKRIYEFASPEKFEAYLSEQGVFVNAETGELYFIITELLPNRRTFEYTAFPIRVNILNAPITGVYANPQIEPVENFEPQNQIISRFATVTQSSTQTGLSYNGTPIDAGAWKAVDGNNNGRINCQFFQQNLLPVGSFSETEIETEPWYDLDLGDNYLIDYIDLWNTVELNGTDLEIPSDHFNNFYVLLSDMPFENRSLAEARALADDEYFVSATGSTKRKISLNDLHNLARYVRIQAVGTNKIKLAEVEVIGKKSDGFTSTTTIDTTAVKVYPNPSAGVFYIESSDLEKVGNVEVYDVIGRLVYSKTIDNTSSFQITLNVPSGMYWLVISGEENHQLVNKIMVFK